MKNSKRICDSIIKIGVVLFLSLAISGSMQYSYYIFLRWFIMTTFIYFSYQSYILRQPERLIYHTSIALIFNPFRKIILQKGVWNLVDILVIAVTTWFFIMDIKKTKNI